MSAGSGRLAGRRRLSLSDGWALAMTAAGRYERPPADGEASWVAASVPGTVAGALGADIDGLDPDDHDWWFTVGFDAEPAAVGEVVVLLLDGLATVCEVWLNDAPVLASESMYASHEADVGSLLRPTGNRLAICCRALTPLLAGRRKPRARWRTKLVSAANLRFYRTMLLGRAPGFAPGPAVVGPWRPVSLERRTGVQLEEVRLRAGLHGDDGTVSLSAVVRCLDGASPPVLRLVVGEGDGATVATVPVADDGAVSISVRVPGVRRWWPHTHGEPVLYALTLSEPGAATPLLARRVGFRALAPAADLVADGPALRINGEQVFCRGAVWTPLSLPAPVDPGRLRAVLGAVVDAGMNMLRVPGIGAYEDDTFYDLCDELGLLVWQDFMFANLDYPEQDEQFMATVAAEAAEVLARLAPRPSLAVVCGGSEVAQQVAMLGLDPALASGPLYGELLPGLVGEAEIDAPYLESAPWGGELPFRPDRGVANYYGVGAYLRPLEDARRAEVRFAAESLAFANVPDEETLERIDAPGGLTVHHPAWKSAVPRDAGAGWDFDDVRDHYLELLYGVDPGALRYSDLERYLELSRAVTGEVMAETFGEWRRAGSPCTGALILWLKDLVPGAGWGVLDDRGSPKVAYHHLRRALAPIAVWGTDEGLGGIVAHVANDGRAPLSARLRVSLYRDASTLVEEASLELTLAPHSVVAHNVEALIGRFVDVTWAYRFGPPAQDLVALTLEDADGRLLSQAFRHPTGRPAQLESLDRIGLTASAARVGEDAWALTVRADRYAHGVRVRTPGWAAADDAFGLEPGRPRELMLRPAGPAAEITGASALPDGPPRGTLTAVNLSGSARITGP